MSSVETGQISAVEAGQMSPAGKRRMQNSETEQRPVLPVDICLETSVLSQQQSSVLSQQQTSVLTQQKTSILSQQKTRQLTASGRLL